MKQRIFKILPYLLLGLVGTLLIVYKIGNYPLLWYDEGARLIVSRTLAETGRYASYSTEGFIPFNPWISAGPLDVLPVAAGIALFGKTAAVLRLSIVPFCILGMFMIVILGEHLFGRRAGWLAALVVICAPALQGNGFLMMSRQVMSENTSFAMAALAIFLWIRSWETGKNWQGWLGGSLLGWGMISKTQAAIWLLPALAVIWLGRFIQDRKRSFREIGFLVSAAVVIVAWYLFVNLQVDPEMQAANWVSMQNSVRLLLFATGDRLITTTTIVLSVVMFLVSGITLVDIFRAPREKRLADSLQWGRATLAVGSLFCVLWFFFLSIRYPRYTYAGWIFTLMLIGWWVDRLIEWMAARFGDKRALLQRWGTISAILFLLLSLGYFHVLPLSRVSGPVAAEQVAAYIDQNVPPKQVIETTEMELFPLTNHWEFHFAPNSVILTATHQIFYERIQPNVSYDFLESKPDYLITGAFSDWIGLYWNSGLLQTNFTQVAEFPPYRIFQRKH